MSAALQSSYCMLQYQYINHIGESFMNIKHLKKLVFLVAFTLCIPSAFSNTAFKLIPTAKSKKEVLQSIAHKVKEVVPAFQPVKNSSILLGATSREALKPEDKAAILKILEEKHSPHNLKFIPLKAAAFKEGKGYNLIIIPKDSGEFDELNRLLSGEFHRMHNKMNHFTEPRAGNLDHEKWKIGEKRPNGFIPRFFLGTLPADASHEDLEKAVKVVDEELKPEHIILLEKYTAR
jgi:hypothetical protein